MKFKPIDLKGCPDPVYETDTGLLCILKHNRNYCVITDKNEQWPDIQALIEIADKLLNCSSFIFFIETEFKQINIIKK